MAKLTIDYGVFETLKGGDVIPHIMLEIERIIKYDIHIEIVSMPDYESPKNRCRSGVTLFPEAYLPQEKEFIVQINPDFKYTSVLAHELCHILITVSKFPRHATIKEERSRFGFHTKIGELIAEYVQHRYIKKYLSRLGIKQEDENEKYWSRLKTRELKPDISQAEIFLRAISLLKTVIDLPEYKKALFEYEGGLSREILNIYFYLKTAITEGPTSIKSPVSMFKLMARSLNIIDSHRRTFFNVESEAQENNDIPVYALNTFLPLFISGKNINKPARDYFRFYPYKKVGKDEPVMLKLIYLYRKNEDTRVSVCGYKIPSNEQDRVLPEYEKKLNLVNVGELLDSLKENDLVKEQHIAYE